MIYRDKA